MKKTKSKLFYLDVRDLFDVWCLKFDTSSRGVTLLDTLIGTALMLVVFLGIAAAFQLSVSVITNNKARAGAIALANERMEYLRSLGYDQIGVIGGIPAGNVEAEEEVTLNGIGYTRRTIVLYTDDPGDGLGEADENNIIADYKTIRVEVVWADNPYERSVTLVGRVSPNGVESAVPGGTLVISVVNESALPVSNAQVDIVNTLTNPAINIRTFTNVDGKVSFIGAPAATEYQVTITKPGYSTASTYAVTAENPNPDPRHLTVAENQTTSSTFTIDYVSTKTVEAFDYEKSGTWNDPFDDDTKLAVMQDTEVQGGRIRVAGSAPFPPTASAQSIAIAPASITGWDTLSWDDSEPGQTEVRYHLYTGDGSTLIPNSALPGNDLGFTESPVDISALSSTEYPNIRLHAILITSPPAGVPSIDEWAVSYTYSAPFPNMAFTLRGAKTIGNNPTVYKYNETHTTDGGGTITLSDMEADTYTIGIASTTGYSLARSCEPQPEALAPASTQTTQIYAVSASANSLLVNVRAEDTNELIVGATANLTRPGYDVTQVTTACGQTFFGNLLAQNYTLTVTHDGYQEYTTGVDVNDATLLSVILNEL